MRKEFMPTTLIFRRFLQNLHVKKLNGSSKLHSEFSHARILNIGVRFSSSAIREAVLEPSHPVQSDAVRDAVRDIMEQREPTKIISLEQLEHSLNNFKMLLKDAKLCIVDCKESESVGAREHQDETEQATEAVDKAYAAYLELLEEFQGCDDDLRKRFSQERELCTTELKALRKELDQIISSA